VSVKQKPTSIKIDRYDDDDDDISLLNKCQTQMLYSDIKHCKSNTVNDMYVTEETLNKTMQYVPSLPEVYVCASTTLENLR